MCARRRSFGVVAVFAVYSSEHRADVGRENEIIYIVHAAPALRNEATEILHEVIPRAIIDVNFADRGVIQMRDHWCFVLIWRHTVNLLCWNTVFTESGIIPRAKLFG